jgi:hypothetical protein
MLVPARYVRGWVGRQAGVGPMSFGAVRALRGLGWPSPLGTLLYASTR